MIYVQTVNNIKFSNVMILIQLSNVKNVYVQEKDYSLVKK